MNISLYKNDRELGIFYSAMASTIWGLLPLYWKLLKQIPAGELLAHRIIWSFVLLMIILSFTKKLSIITKQFSHGKSIVLILSCSILMSINWLTYIWAVNSNHVIEASIGYYITPIVAVILGVVILKEKINKYQKIALLFAIVGIVILVAAYGKIPWISLILAASFGLYGLFKKMANVQPIIGIALETAFMFPISLIYILFKQTNSSVYYGTIGLLNALLLFNSGIATVVPLLLFAQGTKRVDLAISGFIQYISPTISIMLGIFLFKEKFTGTDAISLACILSALIIFSLSNLLMKYEIYISDK